MVNLDEKGHKGQGHTWRNWNVCLSKYQSNLSITKKIIAISANFNNRTIKKVYVYIMSDTDRPIPQVKSSISLQIWWILIWFYMAQYQILVFQY